MTRTGEPAQHAGAQVLDPGELFRCQRSALGKRDRPIFIAYAMWKTLQQWQACAGLGHSPRTILTEFSRIQAADIVLPLVEDTRRELRIRCVVRPARGFSPRA
jgi:hypothetical protein